MCSAWESCQEAGIKELSHPTDPPSFSPHSRQVKNTYVDGSPDQESDHPNASFCSTKQMTYTQSLLQYTAQMLFAES